MTTAIKSKGFTLIELMIAITIVSVLAALALPSYNNYIRTAARADAESQMLKIAGDLERWRSRQLSYTGFKPDAGFSAQGSLVSVGGATIYLPLGSNSGNYKYQIALLDGTRIAALNGVGITTGQGWIMIAQPSTSNSILNLASRLVLNSQGLRCLTDSPFTDPAMNTNIANVKSLSDADLCVNPSYPSKPW
jgi:type IV pilus assembly protein PilE